MADTVKWFEYEFGVYDMNTSWNEVGGIYIFTGVKENVWRAHYVGQAENFKTRLTPNHEQWAAARKLGATHVHARVVSPAASRDAVEKELIQKLQPPLNTQHK